MPRSRFFWTWDWGKRSCLRREREMLNELKDGGGALGGLGGARSATGSAPSAAAEVKRWSAGRKKQVVLRLLRGEPVDALSRELAVPIVRLEEWRDRALAGMDVGLKERENDPLEKQLDEANRRIGELMMEVEILRKEREARRPLAGRRSSRGARRPRRAPACHKARNGSAGCWGFPARRSTPSRPGRPPRWSRCIRRGVGRSRR